VLNATERIPEAVAGSDELTLTGVLITAPDGRPLVEARGVRFAPGVTALAGANGCGKSTLLRAIAGLQPISRGSIQLGQIGEERGRRTLLERLMFLPQNFAAYPDLTGQEFLEYSLRLRGARRSEARRVAANWIEAVGLRDAARTRTGAYSQGMRQRLGFAYALQCDVSLYLLDEPFAGVDPESRYHLTDLLFTLCRDRIAIVSTHHVDEMIGRGAAMARISDGCLVMQC
jgi:ABC-type multidrug transport system ATPase subunit